MKVPFLDLPAQHESIRQEIDQAIDAVIRSTAFASGPFVEEFEDAFARYVGAQHCVGLNSGTTALHLALLASGVGPGDEVVTTPHTWISTSWGISYCGATPVYADVDAATGNLDPAAVDEAITPRTKAILPVDLYGNPADHVAFEKIAADRDIPLVDDAAQAHGSRLDGRRIGSFGSVSCFSFYPGKNLGAMGEGGAIVTNDHDIADRVRTLRDHAQRGRHHHVELGFNARMDGLQAAVLSLKLRHLDDWNARRQQAARRYADLLAGVPGIRMPVVTHGGETSWHLYVIRAENRDGIGEQLTEMGVGWGIHYPTPVHLQPAYSHLGYSEGAFPNAERFAATCLSLPMFPEITSEQQELVAEALKAATEQST